MKWKAGLLVGLVIAMITNYISYVYINDSGVLVEWGFHGQGITQYTVIFPGLFLPLFIALIAGGGAFLLIFSLVMLWERRKAKEDSS